MSAATQIVHNINPSYGKTNTLVEPHSTPMYSPTDYCEPVLTGPKRPPQPASYEEINTPVETHSTSHQRVTLKTPHSTQHQYSTLEKVQSTPHQYSTLEVPQSTPHQYSTLEVPQSTPHQYSTLEVPQSTPHQYSTLEVPQSTPHQYSTLEVPNTCPHKNTEGESTVPKKQSSSYSFNNAMYEKHNKATDDDSKQIWVNTNPIQK